MDFPLCNQQILFVPRKKRI